MLVRLMTRHQHYSAMSLGGQSSYTTDRQLDRPTAVTTMHALPPISRLWLHENR